MDKLSFTNQKGQIVHYLKWSIEHPKACVVISHGMAEHPARYDELALFLNQNGILVYAIYQIGHGEFANPLGHMEKGDFDQCVTNLSELVELAKTENHTKVILLGHSMGSFIAQLYVTRYHNIDALILAGSTKASFKMKAGSTLASLITFFSKDIRKPSPFMDKMAFGNYNRIYENPKTNSDWLNRDEKEVQKYIDDPYCGWIGTKGFFYNLTHGIKEMGKKKNIQNVDKDLPIFIHGGSQDPVSNCKIGLEKLYQQYKDLHVKDVSLIIYEGGRHEIYNETNKQEVFVNTLNFINSHID